MAILNKIRKQGVVLIAVIALALFAFILSDLFRNSDALTNKSQNIIASVNGEDISRESFMQKVEAMQRQLGPNGTSTQAMNRVWNNELRSSIMQGEYDALGITVEKDQMRDIIKNALQNNPTFQNAEGVYDEAKVNEYIANAKATSPQAYQQWLDYEKTLANNAKQQAFFNMVKAGVSGTIGEGKLDYQMENDKVDVKYVEIPFTSIVDSTITVTNSEIASYIKSNPKNYEVEASRDINYIEFKEEPSLEDENAIKARLLSLLDNKVEYNETTKSNDTVIGFRNTTNNADFVNANSVLKFNDNYIYKDKMPLNLVDSIYPLKKGEMYGPYKQDQYYIITKVVEETRRPDSAKVRHILIPFAGATRADAAVTKTPEQAKATADSILKVVKSGKSVKSLLSLSSDKVSNEKDGIIDWFTPDSGLAQEFKDFSFANNKGSVDVVETSFGYHIIEILDQKNYQRVIKTANLALEIEPSETTINNVFNEVSKFEIASNSGDFQALAKEKNYALKPVNTISALDENIPGIGNQRQIVRWAFEEGTDIGDIKRFNLANGGYVLVQLAGKAKKGLMSVDRASVTALPIIRKEKKAQMILDKITSTSVADIAKNQKVSVKTANGVNMKSPVLSGIGSEPKVVGTAFGLTDGQTSKPVVGNKGVFVVELVKKTIAEGVDNSFQAAANRLGRTKANAVNTKLYNALKDAAEIEDNRAKHY